MSDFEDILATLSREIGVTLISDAHQTCCLQIDDILPLYLEFEESKRRLLIASFLGDVHAGAFREQVLKHCLKANALYPQTGIFAFSDRHNQLVLFTYAYPHQFQQQELVALLTSFINLAMGWTHALKKEMIYKT